MKKGKIVFFCYFVLSLLLSDALFAEGTISGVVQGSSTKQPVADALIELLLGKKIVATTKSDPLGNYSFVSVPADSYSVKAQSDSYRCSTKRNVVVEDLATATVNFALVSRGNIVGKVTDAVTGIPIAGAVVEVKLKNVLASATTQPDGTYSIQNINPAGYHICAKYEKYQQSKLIKVSVKSNQSVQMDFALEPHPGVISGVILDDLTGHPLENAEVTLLIDSLLISSTRTKADGSYSFPGLPPKSYTVRVSSGNLQTAINAAVVLPEAATIANFSLKSSTTSILGQVLDEEFTTPISHATIEIFMNFQLIASTQTDNQGSYAIPNLAPGSYQLRIKSSPFETQVLDIILTSQTNQQVPIYLKKSSTSLSGTITNQITHEPLAGAIVDLMQGDHFLNSTLTDLSGTYKMQGLAEGNYYVKVQCKGFQSLIKPTLLSKDEKQILNLSLKSNPGTLMGHATNKSNHSAIVGATIEILNSTQSIATTLTDGQGLYQLDALPPSSYTIQIKAQGFQTSTQEKKILADQITWADFNLLPTSPKKPHSRRLFLEKFPHLKRRSPPLFYRYKIFLNNLLIATIQPGKDLK